MISKNRKPLIALSMILAASFVGIVSVQPVYAATTRVTPKVSMISTKYCPAMSGTSRYVNVSKSAPAGTLLCSGKYTYYTDGPTAYARFYIYKGKNDYRLKVKIVLSPSASQTHDTNAGSIKNTVTPARVLYDQLGDNYASAWSNVALKTWSDVPASKFTLGAGHTINERGIDGTYYGWNKTNGQYILVNFYPRSTK